MLDTPSPINPDISGQMYTVSPRITDLVVASLAQTEVGVGDVRLSGFGTEKRAAVQDVCSAVTDAYGGLINISYGAALRVNVLRAGQSFHLHKSTTQNTS